MASLFTKRNALADFAAPQPHRRPDLAQTVLGQALLTGLAERNLVRNVPGTSEYSCRCCDSWHDHHRKASIRGMTYRFCSAVGCGKVATLGAHIILVCDPDRIWYIVPLCDSHNGLGRAFEIYGHIQLVAAKPLLSCIG